MEGVCVSIGRLLTVLIHAPLYEPLRTLLLVRPLPEYFSTNTSMELTTEYHQPSFNEQEGRNWAQSGGSLAGVTEQTLSSHQVPGLAQGLYGSEANVQ